MEYPVNVFQEEEDGWIGGEIDGRVGYFPKDYILLAGEKLNDRMIKVSYNNIFSFFILIALAIYIKQEILLIIFRNV